MKLDIDATIVFEKNYDALFNSDKRFIINQGSSRSSKTWSLCQLIIIYCLTTPNKSVSIVRKSFPTLRASVMRDFFVVMNELELYNRNNHNKTENIYRFNNGSIIEFFSTDDEQKLRGRKRDICWINEANELLYDDFLQLNIRTTDKLIVDYNPSDADCWIYELDENDSTIIKSTYKDNPFVEKAIIKQLEDLKNTDEALYQIYALGERSMSRKNVYEKWEFIPERPSYFTDYVYGLDFGYNHPTALSKVWYNEKEIFIETLIYESYLTTPELIERMQTVGIDTHNEIMCDFARPEIIKELRNANYNTHNANKAVEAGIRNIKTFKVMGYDYDENLKKEYRNYMWKKQGDRILDEPVKLYDDCFIGDTLITTNTGLIPIRDINIGDQVLTSNGYKKVLLKHNIGIKPVNKYWMRGETFDIYIICTSDHKVKTNKGWIQISKLKSGMMVFLHKNSMEEYINYTQIEDTLHNTNTVCIEKSGSLLMEISQKGIIYTTSMKTLGIIELKTLNVLKHINTFLNILLKELIIIKNGLKTFKLKVLNLQKSGIVQKKVENGIVNTEKNLGSIENTLQKNVKSVLMNTKQDTQELVNSVITIVKLKTIEEVDYYKDMVYDLTIEDEHEFFANGLLVHNCMDATRYAVMQIKKLYIGSTPFMSF